MAQYKVLKKFRGIKENATFPAGEVVEFSDERVKELNENLGADFLEKLEEVEPVVEAEQVEEIEETEPVVEAEPVEEPKAKAPAKGKTKSASKK
jgi:hypothetical protein